MNITRHERLVLFPLLLGAAYWCAACAVALGPGYTIERQEISVAFAPAPEPIIRVNATYQLRNTGNQALRSLEFRLPGRRRFHFLEPRVRWDNQTLSIEQSPANPRDNLLRVPQPWAVGKAHTLLLSVEYRRSQGDESALSFASDAFFLPAQGWSPELLPARGIFATGGVPPKKWTLFIDVPDDFLLHVSGRTSKPSHHGKVQTIRALQTWKDGYPFVIAGRFNTTQVPAGQGMVNVWTRSPLKAETLRPASDAFARAIHAYDAMFGKRGKGSDQLWVVECPVSAGCFSTASSNYAKLLLDQTEKITAEMASEDTVMVDLSSETPQITPAAAPALAASWLGYGENPGFFEQVPPLSALPAFAAFRGHEELEGQQVRPQTIRKLLSRVPVANTAADSDDTALRAKSVLFFYALQDQYGSGLLDAALRHMLQARRGGGFDLDDLIAATEQETHQSVAPFVRLWMKHPGVPAEFRSRYENASASLAVTSKETK